MIPNYSDLVQIESSDCKIVEYPHIILKRKCGYFRILESEFPIVDIEQLLIYIDSLMDIDDKLQYFFGKHPVNDEILEKLMGFALTTWYI